MRWRVEFPVTVSERDLGAPLAGIVTEDRPDPPVWGGLPPSLVADLMSQICCDWVRFAGFDSGRMAYRFGQEIPPIDMSGRGGPGPGPLGARPDASPRYPDRSGDLRPSSDRGLLLSPAWHSSALQRLLLAGGPSIISSLPARSGGADRRAGRTVRLYFVHGPGRISPSATGRFSRCCARTCTRPT